MTLPLLYRKRGVRGFDGKTAKRSKNPLTPLIDKRKKCIKIQSIGRLLGEKQWIKKLESNLDYSFKIFKFRRDKA